MGDLSREENERLRGLIEELLSSNTYRGNLSKLARALGRSQPSLTQIRQGGGISYRTAQVIARLAARPLDALLGRATQAEYRTALKVVGLRKGYDADIIDRVLVKDYRPDIHPDDAFGAMQRAQSERQRKRLTSP